MKQIITFFLFIAMGLSTSLNAQMQQIGFDIDGEATNDFSGKSVSMPNPNTIAIGAPFNNNVNGNASGHVRVYSLIGGSWVQKGADINGENPNDTSGWSVSMPNSDTVAIGAIANNGNGADSGHVRIYSWNGSAWIQKGADINGEASNDRSGYSVSMPDIDVVAIGARGNDGNGNKSGHVRVYNFVGGSWVQKGADINGENPLDVSGGSVSMPDVNTVAIGAVSNDGVNGSNSGHVRIYNFIGGLWVQKGGDIDGGASGDVSGASVSMPDANTIAIGAPGNNTNGSYSGNARVYDWDLANSSWVQRGININGHGTEDSFGSSVSMPNANTVAIGAPQDQGGGIITGTDEGYVGIYWWNGSSWIESNIIYGENPDDESGTSVSMPSTTIVAVGAPVNSNPVIGQSGHARVYEICPPPAEMTNLKVTPACQSTLNGQISFDINYKHGGNLLNVNNVEITVNGIPLSNYFTTFGQVNPMPLKYLSPGTYTIEIITSRYTLCGGDVVNTYNVVVPVENCYSDDLPGDVIGRFILSPNPSEKGYFELEVKKDKNEKQKEVNVIISVINVETGRLLEKRDWNLKEEQTVQFSGYRPGKYLVRVQNKENGKILFNSIQLVTD